MSDRSARAVSWTVEPKALARGRDPRSDRCGIDGLAGSQPPDVVADQLDHERVAAGRVGSFVESLVGDGAAPWGDWVPGLSRTAAKQNVGQLEAGGAASGNAQDLVVEQIRGG